jgi:uncharacterized protein (DUF4213/DUF364 family)
MLSQMKDKTIQIMDEKFKIEDFSLALPYTYVIISGKNGKAIGVAMTLPEEIGSYKNKIEKISVDEFINKADSLNIIERTLALATINAVSQYYIDLRDAKYMDAIEIIENIKNLKIALIGNIPPIAKELKNRGYALYVFERNQKLWNENVLSDSLEYQLLPKMDAVLLSASTLVNGTIDMILDRSKNAKFIILTGPTSQVLPEFLKDTKITHIASMKIVDIDNAVKYLKLGDFHRFSKMCKNFRR